MSNTFDDDEDEGRMVYRRREDIKHASPEELERLANIKDEDIDLSDIPELDLSKMTRAKRNPDGSIPEKPKSMLRDAILRELGRKKITRYELCQRARKHCSTLSDSAVYEYLRGQRQVGADYIEAMLLALSLKVTPEAA